MPPYITRPSTAVGLYRYLLRCVQRLPPDAQKYYTFHVRQNFTSHADETDPVRVQQIIQRAQEDAAWVLKKYKKEMPA